MLGRKGRTDEALLHPLEAGKIDGGRVGNLLLHAHDAALRHCQNRRGQNRGGDTAPRGCGGGRGQRAGQDGGPRRGTATQDVAAALVHGLGRAVWSVCLGHLETSSFGD